MIPHSWIEVARIMVQEREKNWKANKERQEAMLRDLEAARDWDEVPRDEVGRIAAVRRQVGAAMIRAGERLQGRQRPEVAADRHRDATLRTAR